MTHDAVISELCHLIQTPRVELTLSPRFYKVTNFVQVEFKDLL
jgi:hypothetical protein